MNAKQKITIKKCINVLNSWLNTNDINSPSHYTIIDEYMFDLEEDINDEINPNLLSETLKDAFNIIKNLK